MNCKNCYKLFSGFNVDSKTDDGITSVHLATKQGHFEVTRILVKEFQANINICHEIIGTPLHCAAKGGHTKIVAYLLMENANIGLRTGDGKLAIEMSTDEKISYLLKEYEKNYLNKSKEKIFVASKPPKVKGILYKIGSIFRCKNKRYFILDPDSLTLTKYIKRQNELKKKVIYPLSKIKNIKKLTHLNTANWYYFEFYCERKHQFCSKSENIVDMWLKYLNSAIIYNAFLNNLTKTIESPSVTEELKAINSKLLEYSLKSSREEIELEPQTTNIRKSLLSQLEEEKHEDKVNFSSFTLLEKIGSGAFGSVFKVTHNLTGETFAMKAISKRYLLRTQQLKYALSESQLLKVVNHPFIIKMHYAFQTFRYLYFIIDYCNCGDLAMHIAKNAVFKENEAQFYIAELILAIEYLHSLNIVYRDLKPENLLIGNNFLLITLGDDGHLRLSDFGLAKQILKQGSQSKSFCGSLYYLSPEMVTMKSSDKTIDIYGIGIILYEMLSGFPPFYNEEQETVLHNIQYAKLQIPKYISPKACAVLKALLERDPAKRITLLELKRHPFFEGINWEDILNKRVAPPFTLKGLEETTKAYLTSKRNSVNS